MKNIKQILVDGQGWKYAKDGMFEWTSYNGQMEKQPWLKQHTADGVKEYNLCYVIQIEYFDDITLKAQMNEIYMQCEAKAQERGEKV